MPTPETLIAGSGCLVVKVGSSLLIDAHSGKLRATWLATLAADLAGLQGEGKKIVLVSSGAVALGRAHLGLRKSARLDHKQAAAAAGQSLLMRAWEQAMAPHGVRTAQLLLTLDDTERRRRWLNARATLNVLLDHRALPIINENDSVATEELRYGDNDRLSARTAQMVSADLLILLSDVDGLYTADPRRSPEAERLSVIDDVDDRILSFAGGTSDAGVGTGGMRTKLAAAQIARAAGCATIITSGQRDAPLSALREGAPATIIRASGSPSSAYKQWIAGTLAPSGRIIIDAGAVRALGQGRSLLPAGITAVEGEFERGACVSILAEGRELARGLSAYPSADARLICGHPSREIEARLGYRGADELIHRNDLVMLDP